MKTLNFKIISIIILALIISNDGFCQSRLDTNIYDVVIKNPIFYLKMDKFRENNESCHSGELNYNEQSCDYLTRSYYCPILFEIKNETNTDKNIIRLNIDSYNYIYGGIFPNSKLKPGASVFYLSTMISPNCSAEISPLMATTVSGQELYKYHVRGGISYGFNNRVYGYFNYKESLKSSHLFAIDTLVGIKDTVQLKNKYVLYKVIDHFYVLHDTIRQNDLFGAFYDGKWKPKMVAPKDIEVQTEHFYYKELEQDPLAIGKDSINKIVRERRVIAHITVTNHSQEYLYVKKNINTNPNLKYTLSYFGQEADEKNATMKALAPNASLIVTINVNYETVQKNKCIEFNTHQLFINCSKARRKINFTSEYSVD
jgi:hypothetical protein